LPAYSHQFEVLDTFEMIRASGEERQTVSQSDAGD
jgi:hypothetical protein